MEVWCTGWYADKRKAWMFNIQDLLVQWLNEIVLDVNATVNTQKWIRVLVTYRNLTSRNKCTIIVRIVQTANNAENIIIIHIVIV